MWERSLGFTRTGSGLMVSFAMDGAVSPVLIHQALPSLRRKASTTRERSPAFTSTGPGLMVSFVMVEVVSPVSMQQAVPALGHNASTTRDRSPGVTATGVAPIMATDGMRWAGP